MTATTALPTTAAELAARIATQPTPAHVDPPVYVELVAAIGHLPAAEMYHAAAQHAYDQRAAARANA
jgi:hypothetical protein